MQIIHLGGDSPTKQIESGEKLRVELGAAPDRYYRHGWQSWSLAAWTEAGVRLPAPMPHYLHPMQVDPLWAFHPGPHGSWVGAAEMGGGQVVLLGSLGLEAHVELDGNALSGRYAAGSGEWLIARGSETEVLAAYAAELGRRLGKTEKQAPRGVWCSWYSLYTDIDEGLLDRIFSGLGDLPFDVLQVDDGWQQAIGDWEPNAKFSAGMKALAGRIKSSERKAGLWLAPLIAVKSSQLFRMHPDWFLRDERGKLVSAGINWGEQLYALDTTQPVVQDWLRELMKQVREWGYDYLKLDFLYGGALPGVRSRQMGREAALREALAVLREGMGGDAYFLGCGVPILPALGVCDALRVGPDVSPSWESQRDARLLHNPAIPGVRNAIRTSLNRLWVKPLLAPDPDPVYFRSRNCTLTDEQKRLLQGLALICGFRATSDLPQWLTPQERDQLREFLAKTPTIEQTGPGNYRVDGVDLDYSNAMEMAGPGNAWERIASAAFGLLANRRWAMKVEEWLRKRETRIEG